MAIVSHYLRVKMAFRNSAWNSPIYHHESRRRLRLGHASNNVSSILSLPLLSSSFLAWEKKQLCGGRKEEEEEEE